MLDSPVNLVSFSSYFTLIYYIHITSGTRVESKSKSQSVVFFKHKSYVFSVNFAVNTSVAGFEYVFLAEFLSRQCDGPN